jgi:hypothetical protein
VYAIHTPAEFRLFRQFFSDGDGFSRSAADLSDLGM